jgi:hypothetical protein
MSSNDVWQVAPHRCPTPSPALLPAWYYHLTSGTVTSVTCTWMLYNKRKTTNTWKNHVTLATCT